MSNPFALPAVLDAAAVAAAFRTAPRGATLDFAAVRELDSSAVALVRALGAQASSVPERYRHLLAAHRLEAISSPP